MKFTNNTIITASYKIIEIKNDEQVEILKDKLTLEYDELSKFMGNATINQLFANKELLLQTVQNYLNSNEAKIKKLHSYENTISSTFIVKINPNETKMHFAENFSQHDVIVCIKANNDIGFKLIKEYSITNIKEDENNGFEFTLYDYDDMEEFKCDTKCIAKNFIKKDSLGEIALLLQAEYYRLCKLDENLQFKKALYNAVDSLMDNLENQSIIYTKDLLIFLVENYDIQMFSQCHNCNEYLFPYDEAYEDSGNENQAICDWCSEYDEITDNYYRYDHITYINNRKILIEGLNSTTFEKYENHIDDVITSHINDNSYESGKVKVNDREYNWQILTDCEEKLRILERSHEVVFETGQLIYQIVLRCDGNYEYNVYSLSDFNPGEYLHNCEDGTFKSINEVLLFMSKLI